MGAETRYAAVETAAEYQEMYPDFEECRNDNHPWKCAKVEPIPRQLGGGVERVSVCVRCKCIRTQFLKNGVTIRPARYQYPDGFLMPPGGVKKSRRGQRVPAGGNKAVLLDLSVQRVIAQQREANLSSTPMLRVVKEAS